MTETAEPTILMRREGAAGTLLMNRPKTLNALDLEMIRGFQVALDAWTGDPEVKLVVLEGAGRAFCAGGDVRRVREQAIAGDAAAIEAFFAEEYAVNRGIARFGKPWVSLIDGVCMGGGIGVSVHGRPVVVTETAMLAMPETAIALFPDVGTSHILPQLPGAIGTWLALTGARLRGADAVTAGLASHFVPKERLPALREALLGGDVGVIDRFAEAPPEASFAPHRAAIDRCFDRDTMPAILSALAAERTDWAAEQLKILRRMSPTSLCVSLELLRRGAGASLDECLSMELALTRSVVNLHPDFREGVRSVLVDKDGTPHWSPSTIEEVDPAVIARLFEG
ncbi:enoyl-CoA hydratase/isomerase family protein [Belnapia sp. T6]|uniref:3-hydroxyisobutyryl-CoA hydrolase n=1 Tax=Belnapia mucosa TaxID=2804532 RepID=A0ABS1VAA6_9PROT|nr:enoyl-CoA hydratase/isomerase family protein [Belnapia mucosa]MBL6458076.1 enoyl-CoA hydratase/isomerase family protein [Belnapia mucosa]